jgi:hypothetical protein
MHNHFFTEIWNFFDNCNFMWKKLESHNDTNWMHSLNLNNFSSKKQNINYSIKLNVRITGNTWILLEITNLKHKNSSIKIWIFNLHNKWKLLKLLWNDQNKFKYWIYPLYTLISKRKGKNLKQVIEKKKENWKN